MLKWTVAELQKFRKHPLTFKQTLDLEASLKQRDAAIISLAPVQVQGSLQIDDPFIISLFQIKTTLVYPSTRSLQPVTLPIATTVNEAYALIPENEIETEVRESQELILPIEYNQIDLQKAVADNVLLSIPTQVLTPQEKNDNVMPHGQDWTVMSETEYEEQQRSQKLENSQFAQLKNLFPKDEHSD